MIRRIALIALPHARPDAGSYWIGAVAQCWAEDGIEVRVVTDPASRPQADLAVLHVDLTMAPPAYLDLARRFPVTLNGGVADISKRSVSANLLERGDPWSGPVIVKSDRNSSGAPERRAARAELAEMRDGSRQSLWRRLILKRRRNRLRQAAATASPGYRILPSLAEVPDEVWSRRELVVERFLPERRGSLYCVRTWLFLGDRDRHALFTADDPIVKAGSIVGHEPLGAVPEELRDIRRRLRFDFGKFDYVIADGRVVLFDANRTPSFGSFPPERYRPIARSLADGLRAMQGGSDGPLRSAGET